ncbi:MAG: alkaline phosphatase family protein [Verrucomicrobiota bacterium]
MSRTLHLFIFADALGWELVQHYEVLKSVTPNQNKCETLFGYSATCDPTILTGASPRDHGHFSFFVQCDPVESPFKAMRYFGWLPDRIAGYHKIRNRLSRYVAKSKGYTGYFQLYSVPFRFLHWLDYTEKKDIYEPGGIIGGQESIFEVWKRSGKPWNRSDWRNGDAKNYAEAEQLIQQSDVELVYLFTAGLDAVMHRYGPWSAKAKDAFAAFDQRIQSLMRLAESQYDEVRLAIFSDHGMTEVRQTSDLRLRCERLPLHYGTDYIAVWDSTMARFWFHNDKAREIITDLLQSANEGRILETDTLKEWRCDFPNHAYGELFYLLHPGVLFVPSFLNLSKVPGMHGYAPDDKDSAACWLTNFEPHQPVSRLEDIFPVMQHAAMSYA